MPQISEASYPPSKEINDAADTERSKRCEGIDLHWQYYDGDHKKPLKIKPGQGDDNVILNLCAQGVDKLAQGLTPETPTITLPGGRDRVREGAELVEQVSAEQQRLDEFWKENQLEILIVDIVLSGIIAGHTFVRLYRENDSDQGVRVAMLDPRMCSAFWLIGNTKRALWYRLEWETEGKKKRRQDIVPTAIIRRAQEEDTLTVDSWTILEYEQAERAEWKLVGEDIWELPFAPIVDWKNLPAPLSFYGKSDMKGAVAINDGVNFTASNISRILKYHAHPKSVATGVDKLNAESGVDGLISIPKDSAKVYNLEMQSDLGSSMAFLGELKEAFFAQTHVLNPAAIKDKVGGLTNFGVRMLFADMLANIRQKQMLYGGGLAEISRRAMAMMGTEVQTPIVTWGDPLPVNRKELVETLEKEKALGTVSIQTASDDLERDYDKESQQIEEETTDAGVLLGNVMNTVGTRGVF